MSNRRNARPARPTTLPARRQALHHHERREALHSNDPAQVRAWAQRWGVPLLPCTDVELMEAMAAAQMEELKASLWQAASDRQAPATPPPGGEAPLSDFSALEAACARVAADIVTKPRPIALRLIDTLEHSRPIEPLRREMDRLIAAQARRLLAVPTLPIA